MEIANDNLSKMSVSEPAALSQNASEAFLTSRLAIGLAIIAASHALLLGWALAAPGTLPLAGVASIRILPYLSCALATALAALYAPLLFPPLNRGGQGGVLA